MTRKETYISRQARRLSKGQIDRRRFVMSALATGVTMPTAMSLASRAEAARPKPGGHLRFAVSSEEALQRHLGRATGVTGPGPYKLAERPEDGAYHLVRNPEHGQAGTGHFDTIEIRYLPDPRLRQSAVMTGEVDVIDAVDPRALAMLSSLPEVGISETEGGGHVALDLLSPDPHVKAALRAAIDRSALLERGFLGHGVIGDDHPLRSAAPEITHDPDRARWHLKAAGLRRVRLGVDASGPGSAALLALMNAATETVGITLAPVAPGEPVSVTLRHLHAPPSPETGNEGQDAPFDPPRASTNRLIPVWTNDLVAHSARLAHAPATGSEGILTDWWFL